MSGLGGSHVGHDAVGDGTVDGARVERGSDSDLVVVAFHVLSGIPSILRVREVLESGIGLRIQSGSKHLYAAESRVKQLDERLATAQMTEGTGRRLTARRFRASRLTLERHRAVGQWGPVYAAVEGIGRDQGG